MNKLKKKSNNKVKREERKIKNEEIKDKKDKSANKVLNILKIKMDETKRANSLSDDIELSLEELSKNRPIKTQRETAKQKAEHEIQKISDSQANLFKLCLNKEKWYYKEMEGVDVIAEANSVEENSTAKNSLTNKLDINEIITQDLNKASEKENKLALKTQNISFSKVIFEKKGKK